MAGEPPCYQPEFVLPRLQKPQCYQIGRMYCGNPPRRLGASLQAFAVEPLPGRA
jgi:hypothetical protein